MIVVIRAVCEKDLTECVRVIRSSFLTVANNFGFTVENAPGFTAFATTEDRLKQQLLMEHRPMYAFCDEGAIVGYYSLFVQNSSGCELNQLCVLPEYRHKGIGAELLEHAFGRARELGCSRINIGIVDENIALRKWYESFGFVHTASRKSARFPFTCGFMEKNI